MTYRPSERGGKWAQTQRLFFEKPDCDKSSDLIAEQNRSQDRLARMQRKVKQYEFEIDADGKILKETRKMENPPVIVQEPFFWKPTGAPRKRKNHPEFATVLQIPTARKRRNRSR
jgi:hypothetical protein